MAKSMERRKRKRRKSLQPSEVSPGLFTFVDSGMAYGDSVGWFQSPLRTVGEVLVIGVDGKSVLLTKSK